jgi:hypothetical protein
MTLAKHHGLDVRLHVQPQRAAFPCVLGAAVVGGRCWTHRPPAACLGVLQEATLHQTGALSQLRHAAGLRIPRSLAAPDTHGTRELYDRDCWLGCHLTPT